MILISSLLGCRNCLKTDGVRHTYSLSSVNFQEYKMQTEFEVMEILERWREESKVKCSLCGSSNVEAQEIEISNYELYNFDRLVERCKSKEEYLLMINIDKKGSDISLQNGGSPQLHWDFFKDAILKLISVLDERPANNFIEQIKGKFFICLSGGVDSTGKTFVSLERFSNSGLTKSEILNTLKPLAKQAGILIKSEDSILPFVYNPIFGKKFKGAVFSSWFYTSIEERNIGIPYSCASFSFDENTIIAFGTASNESPREFIDNNRYNNFIVDEECETLIRDGKKIYFAKKI